MAAEQEEYNVAAALKKMWRENVSKFSKYSLNDMEEMFEIPSADDFSPNNDVKLDVYLENPNVEHSADGVIRWLDGRRGVGQNAITNTEKKKLIHDYLIDYFQPRPNMSATELLRYKMKCVDLIEYINDLKQRKKEMKEDKQKEKNSVQGMNKEINNIDNKIIKLKERIKKDAEQIEKLKDLRFEIAKNLMKQIK